MVIYDSCDIYIESKQSAKDKIASLDQIINTLLTTATKAAVNENITEYTLDDGQTKIRCNYRGVDAIMTSIKSLEKIKQIYINQINGRTMRMVDGKSINPYNRYYGRF